LKKDLQKVKEQHIELTKSNDALKKKYMEEVDSLKVVGADATNELTEKVNELE
jgi:hypothetical protein